MEWTSESIDQLRALWAEGHSTAEIGRRMGISKNAVVGKAHRLNLPPRPSPIRREGFGGAVVTERRLPPPRRAPAPRPAMPLRRLEPTAVPAAARAAAAPPPGQPAPAPSEPATTTAAQVAVLRPFPRMNLRCCAWPHGDPGTADFRFCGAEALAGKPYCPEHAALAYVKVRDRREDAA